MSWRSDIYPDVTGQLLDVVFDVIKGNSKSEVCEVDGSKCIVFCSKGFYK